jgi:hypothetical protein
MLACLGPERRDVYKTKRTIIPSYEHALLSCVLNKLHLHISITMIGYSGLIHRAFALSLIIHVAFAGEVCSTGVTHRIFAGSTAANNGLHFEPEVSALYIMCFWD